MRPFILRYPKRMLPILHEWATDDNEHVRRLAAEGSRPRGVWVAHIKAFKDDLDSIETSGLSPGTKRLAKSMTVNGEPSLRVAV